MRSLGELANGVSRLQQRGRLGSLQKLYDSITVRMMGVGRVIVHDRVVVMRMAVRLACRIRGVTLMLVVFVVTMQMLVIGTIVRVQMAVTLFEEQTTPKPPLPLRTGPSVREITRRQARLSAVLQGSATVSRTKRYPAQGQTT